MIPDSELNLDLYFQALVIVTKTENILICKILIFQGVLLYVTITMRSNGCMRGKCVLTHEEVFKASRVFEHMFLRNAWVKKKLFGNYATIIPFSELSYFV